MTAGIVQDQDMEKKSMDKQIGCMAGFFKIFDRHQILAGKRVYSTKRLPSSPPTTNSPSSSEKSSEESPVLPVKPSVECPKSPLPPNISILVAPEVPAKIAPTANESKEGVKSWKFREYPRLSLDSRVIVDGKGSVYPREIRTNAAFISATGTNAEEEQRRSPSVVARLMGLEILPEFSREPIIKKPELKRSSSESGLSNRFVDIGKNAIREKIENSKANQDCSVLSRKQPRKNFFDTQDFFPEAKEKESSIYGELEKRLKMRGINEQADDLQTLKQILEALQLKGLLHSKKRLQRIGNRNFIFDQENPHSIKQSKSLRSRRNESPPPNLRTKAGIRRNITDSEALPPVRRRLERSYNEKERRFSHSMSPDRSETNARSPCSPARTQRRRNDSVDSRRNTSANSPKIIPPRKNGSNSPRNSKRSMTEICRMSDDETSSISSCMSTISQKSPRLKRDEYKEEANLLARCDKLLNSIAEISITESQPSPVSVLDSSFYQEDISPLKRCIDFKDQEDEEDTWSPIIKPIEVISNDADFVYVLKIIEATKYISGDFDLFHLLEKQVYKSCDASSLHRRLVFDTIVEILDRKKQLPPWKAVSSIDYTTEEPSPSPSFKQIWLDFSKIRERSKAEDLLEVICEILQKDVADETINDWSENAMEKSEMVLDIEKLIFKDLIGDTIQDLAEMGRKRRDLAPKKLVF